MSGSSPGAGLRSGPSLPADSGVMCVISRRKPGPTCHTGQVPGHVGDTPASLRGCLPSLQSTSAEMDGSGLSDVLMPRYTAGHLFGLNLENPPKIVRRRLFPGVPHGVGGLGAQLPVCVPQRAALTRRPSGLGCTPRERIEETFAATPFKNSIHLSSRRAHACGLGR